MGKITKKNQLVLDEWGYYLGIDKSRITVKDRWGEVKHYPLLFQKELSEVVLRSGNYVSTEALETLAAWNIDVLISTQYNKPVAMLRSLDDDSHVKTRLCQYASLSDERCAYIAGQILLAKLKGQASVLKRWGLPEGSRPDELPEIGDIKKLRQVFTGIEGKYGQFYFSQIFKLFPESVQPEMRITYRAYEGLNNIFNMAYTLLSWRVHRAVVNAKLEPYLGYLHSTQPNKPSLVCDLVELYRFLVDDCLIKWGQGLRKKDFVLKSEYITKTKVVNRIYLDNLKAEELAEVVNSMFLRVVEIPKLRNGEKQTISTLIQEEAQLLAKYLRVERKTWIPRIPTL